MKLNIGCGMNKMDGFINIDKAPEVEPDKIIDIEKGLPFKDNQFTHIYSEHCLEHIRPDKWSFVLNEIARVSKEGCILELKLPYGNWRNLNNIDHYRTFDWWSFDQLLVGRQRNYYSKLTMVKLTGNPNFFKKLYYYLFPFMKYEVYFKFRVVKNRLLTKDEIKEIYNEGKPLINWKRKLKW